MKLNIKLPPSAAIKLRDVDIALSGLIRDDVGEPNRVKIAGDWHGHYKWEQPDGSPLEIERLQTDGAMRLTLGPSPSSTIYFDECGYVTLIEDDQGEPINAVAATQVADAIWLCRRHEAERYMVTFTLS